MNGCTQCALKKKKGFLYKSNDMAIQNAFLEKTAHDLWHNVEDKWFVLINLINKQALSFWDMRLKKFHILRGDLGLSMVQIFFIWISQHIYTLTLKRQPTVIFFCHHVSLQLAKTCTISMLKHHDLWMGQTENGKTHLWNGISAHLMCHRVLHRPGQPKKENKMRLTSQHDSISQYDKAPMQPNLNAKPPRTSTHTHTLQDKQGEKLPSCFISFKRSRWRAKATIGGFWGHCTRHL